MIDFFIAIGAGLLAVVGIVCVAAGTTVVFACLIPASYLAALMLTLRSPGRPPAAAPDLDDPERSGPGRSRPGWS